MKVSRYSSWVCICLAAVLACAAPTDAADPPASILSATRIEGAPDTVAWDLTPTVADFVQREPSEGGSPSQRTDVRVLFDASGLFVRVRAFDAEPDRVISYLTRRDEDCPCDWISVLIDSYHDRRTAYEFSVNPSGVKRDAYWYNDTNRDQSWDAVWDVSVSRDVDGWRAEFRIPFSQLRFAPTADSTFGFAVTRQVGRLKETSTWPLLARSATGFVSSFGELRGLSMSGSPSKLELVPYSLGQVVTQPTGNNPLVDATDRDITAGIDAKYAITPALTLTTTINPDFGQVEADPAVVNLSAFETFFEERRPFFVEGVGNFAFGLDCPNCNGLFYSRRIGRAPQATGDLPSGDDVYTASPVQTTILGSAKLTGRVGKVSLGVLHSATGEEVARVLTGNGTSRPAIEPFTNYSVATARRDFANQSAIGAIVTSTNRRPTEGLSFLSDHAHTGGMQFDWRLARRYSVNGNAFGSYLTGTPEAIDRIARSSRHYFQRPDALVDRLEPGATSMSGFETRLSFSKIGGQRVRFNSNLMVKSAGFEINDLGFMQRADERKFNNWIQFRSDIPNRWFRSRMINFNQYARWSYDGEFLSNGGNVNAHAVFQNNWSTGGGWNLNHRELDDRRSRGGPAGYIEGFTNIWNYINTDDRKPVSAKFEWNVGRDGHGSSFYFLEPEFSVRPIPPFTAAVGFKVNHEMMDKQWVANVTEPATHYVFGRLDRTTVSLTTRVSYTMSPTLSLQLYGEPFVSAGDYTDIQELVDGRNPVYEARYTPYAYSSDPDFNVKSFRTTNVLRWEYRPGSSLFVVWQQARSGSDANAGTFRFSRDIGSVFTTPATNVFLVKFAYWFNY